MLFNLFLFSCQLMYYGLGIQWEVCIYLGCIIKRWNSRFSFEMKKWKAKLISFVCETFRAGLSKDETVGCHFKWRNEKHDLFHLFVRLFEQACNWCLQLLMLVEFGVNSTKIMDWRVFLNSMLERVIHSHLSRYSCNFGIVLRKS